MMSFSNSVVIFHAYIINLIHEFRFISMKTILENQPNLMSPRKTLYLSVQYANVGEFLQRIKLHVHSQSKHHI